MNHATMMLGAAVLATAIACSASEAPRESAAPATAESAGGAEAKESADSSEPASFEVRVARIRALLGARHPGDLPSREVLERHVGAGESLRWLAQNDDTQVVRVRALTLLRHDPTSETRSLLVEVARDASLPAGVRAAALRGMVGFDLSNDAELRDELASRLAETDPMLAVAAVQTLAAQPSTVELVRAAASDASLPEATRDAATRELARD